MKRRRDASVSEAPQPPQALSLVGRRQAAFPRSVISSQCLLVDHTSYQDLVYQQILRAKGGAAAEGSRKRFCLRVRVGITEEGLACLASPESPAGSASARAMGAFTPVDTSLSLGNLGNLARLVTMRLRCLCRFEDGETEAIAHDPATGFSTPAAPVGIRLGTEPCEVLTLEAWEQQQLGEAAGAAAAAAGAAGAEGAEGAAGGAGAASSAGARAPAPAPKKGGPSIVAIYIDVKAESLPITSEFHNRRFRLGFFLDGQRPRGLAPAPPRQRAQGRRCCHG